MGRWLIGTARQKNCKVGIVAFPNAGVGSSAYRDWPDRINGAPVLLVQPPGRENRLADPMHRTHSEYATQVCSELEDVLDAGCRLLLLGHCGAVPYMLETAAVARKFPGITVEHLAVSSWGPPQHGLYGDLNFADLETLDYVTEVSKMAQEQGIDIPQELSLIAAEVLEEDLRVQRAYNFTPLHEPVNATVIGWSNDAVVAAKTATDDAWRSAIPGEVRFETLTGGHEQFPAFPPALQQIVEDIIESMDSGDVGGHGS